MTPTCDMVKDCGLPIEMIDDKGFAYCGPHGRRRQGGGIRCRKLRPHELSRINRGETIASY